MAKITNLIVYAGEDVSFNDTIYSSPPTPFSPGTPQNIAGWSLAFTMDNTSIYLTTAPGGGVVITDPANGIVTVTLAGALTALLQAPFNYVWSISRTDPGQNANLSGGVITLELR
jgi:hypothetical protein